MGLIDIGDDGNACMLAGCPLSEVLGEYYISLAGSYCSHILI
jgi:hypothetical protein